MPDDQRLIEDYIPIEAISEEARREKSIRKGHISTLHLWWARRPLVASRAAVYGALMPAPQGKKAEESTGLFVKELCKYPGSKEKIEQARNSILQAHAARLSVERGSIVAMEDIEAGRAPRPRVLDMFAGGGSIPLEALRLGCEAHALDLNPVAHIIELCTLVYPQQFGKPDPSVHGSASDGTWSGLANEVEYWGKWVLEKVREAVSDLYPPIPDPGFKPMPGQPRLFEVPIVGEGKKLPDGWLTPVAFLWTRTVRCNNPSCGGVVPLARQTWLVKKTDRFVALRPDPNPNRNKEGSEKTVVYKVVEASTVEELGFDPEGGNRHGSVACPFCGTVATSSYLKAEGMLGRIGVQPMVIACTKPSHSGRIYLTINQVSSELFIKDKVIMDRIKQLENESLSDAYGSILIPDEPLPLVDARGAFFVKLYGFEKWSDLFTGRQLLSIMTFVKAIHNAAREMIVDKLEAEHSKAITTYLGLVLDKIADTNNSFCAWEPIAQCARHLFGRQALPMIWDFGENIPIGESSGGWNEYLTRTLDSIHLTEDTGEPAKITRGTATAIPYNNGFFDAVITDPPYYDNVPYSDLSDFFFIWLKRSIGFLYPEHFSSQLTPKKQEAIMDAGRHNRDLDAARFFYEKMMAQAFVEAGRVLKAGAPMLIVYAHKTTSGWTTLIDALKRANFTVVEAWPLDTENTSRMRAMQSAALASSIFMVTKSREGNEIGSFERNVQPELRTIIRERLDRLWAQGISGADLVIACIGAGLRAFTRYARVEYANGAEVPAEKFLAEVEGAVLDALLEKLFGVSQAGVNQVDISTRFYILWRYAYHQTAVDAGEAIVFAYPLRIELDGPRSLSGGHNPLVEKSKGSYRLRDFVERGEHPELGRANESGQAALIDTLQRMLWLIENHPSELHTYLDEVHPDLERLRAVAQALAGPALGENGGAKSSAAETAALRKLTANWRSLVEENIFHRR